MRAHSRTTKNAHAITQGRTGTRTQWNRSAIVYQTIQFANAFPCGRCTRGGDYLCHGTRALRNSETRSAMMTTPYEAMKQQRLMWGSALVVGFILIYYGGAPIIPVIAGCVLVPAITALRSWLRSRK